jgi:hypothetical protein
MDCPAKQDFPDLPAHIGRRMTAHFGHYLNRVLAYFSLPDLISCPHWQVLPEDRVAGRRLLSSVGAETGFAGLRHCGTKLIEPDFDL